MIIISEIFRALPHLRELRSSISIHVFRGFFLFTSKFCIKYCFFADLMALFTCDFVPTLLISLPSRPAIFLNSNFLHIIPFIDFASQFMCNPRGVFIGDRFTLKWGILINDFHK